ncbi:phosphoribosyltransferase [Allomuricauda ruestringensis DSM 13258]|uniref:Phosphoribosyltransferase n=1 Tax=Allomuricauda ruestringensis (strain DSM 13258 / CIP 107369 / LMG 19739 / B1) TaxID=886377 RepID=G2PRQ2_ALLRU|nr:phosphoribosyltransferase family protein [Allomuricauda ruestringensis]AEM69501.1 phosphoribosyltransferase [Allomuricauda ruestringensis DSM 13258]
MFRDREDAALQLAERLEKYKNQNIVVLAIPKGGLPLGAIIAKTLNAPLDVALSKKIGHPYNKEYAIGAVSLEDVILSYEHGVETNYIAKETQRIREKLQRKSEVYHKNKVSIPLKDKTVIIVDDGVATGNTIKVTAQLVQHQDPRKTIVAIPVAPHGAVQNLQDSKYIDEVICLLIPRNFHAVGQFYSEFEQVSEEEAIELLEQTNGTVNP